MENNLNIGYQATLILLFALSGTAPTLAQTSIPVSPHDFPYGYPFPDYPVAGAAHPSLSADYMSDPVFDENQVKRVAQYALRLIQTDRMEEAVQYLDKYREMHPGYMDQEIFFMKAMALSRLGRVGAAAESMKMAIVKAGLPPQRFLAGPRRMFTNLHNHHDFIALWEEQQDSLVHGPMLGAMTDRSVQVWVRTISETPVRIAVSRSPDMNDPVVTDAVLSQSGEDYTAEVLVDNLVPDTQYYYEVLLGKDRRKVGAPHQKFRTYPEQNRSSGFHIAFGGCAGYVPHNERMWDTIARFEPRAFLTLGDNVYIDDPESPDQQRLMYYQRQSRPEFRRLVGASPVYAIWDDHDFSMDDSWGGPTEDLPYWKPMVWEIFQQNWVNPGYANGNRPGGWYDFHIADIHFIMPDARYYREDPGRFGGGGVEDPTMLGPDQLEWLKNTLAGSEATFKVLVSPVPWHYEAKGEGQNRVDGWIGYRKEREEIFSWIDEHRINGVLLLSSDRHRSDAWVTGREEGYDLYEFSSGQFTNQHTHPVLDGSLFGYNDKPSFGLLYFDTEAKDPAVTYKVVDIDGNLQHTLTVKRSQLTY